MARKKRCTLCGGKILPSGICAECGWDNSKNDEGYRLNTHNGAGMRLHEGDCEDVLNRKNPHKQAGTSDSADHMAKGDSARTRTEKMSGGNTRTRTEKMSGGNTRTRTEKMSGGNTRTRTEGTSAGSTRPQTKRTSPGEAGPQAGHQPVRKKHRLLRWLIVLFFAWEILDTVFSDAFSEVQWFLSDLAAEIREAVEESGFLEDRFSDEDDWIYSGDDEDDVGIVANDLVNGTDSDERPEREIWDEDSEGYVSMELTQGYYTVGYEIPAGEYQLECFEDTAWISFYYTADEVPYYDYLILYSEEEQEAYPEYMDGEECLWYELSPVITLEEGVILAVDSMSSDVWLTGEGEGMDSLKERKEQHLNNILLSEAEVWTVGEEGFEEGIYDLVVSGEGASAYVRIESENGYENYTGIILDENWDKFLHYPFLEGDSLTVTLYNEDTEVWLLPSW
ncbi:MAG: hypothetical protein LUI87_11850 [Lachnospiraceae bacterium]|nr:hypothetical protein [Lachnospiraceae bacterium]